MRPAPTLALLLLAGAALAAPPEGPPYYDRKRGLEAQQDAARAAGDEAKTSTDAARLAALLADDSGLVRDRVFDALVERDDDAHLRALLPHLGHKDEFVSAAVAELFAQRRWAEGREALEKVGLAHRSEPTALEAVWALEAIADAGSAGALEKAFKRRREHRVRGDALIALATVAPAAARPIVDGALGDDAPPVRLAALVALARLDPTAAAAAAVDVVAARPLDRKDRPWEPRLLLAALETLREWTARAASRDLVVRAVDALIERLAREEEGLPRHEVGLTLDDLTGAGGLDPDPEVWRGWWAARRETFQPQDKAPPPAPAPRRRRGKDEPDGEAPAAPARPETGAEGRTRVRFHGIPVVSRRLAFAQDMSGGMNNPLDKGEADSPSKLQFSKDELVRVLEALPDDARTNVVFFASDFWRHADQLVPIGRARAALVGFVREAATPDFRKAQDRHRSRSNLYDPLAFLLEDPELDTVFFLSEGAPNEGRFVDRERFLRHLVRLNVYQRVRVHTLQVTNDRAGATFLRRLAEATGGRFHDVEALKAARQR